MGAPGEFGRILRRLRDERGWSRVVLAQRSQVGRHYIAKLELGGREDPGFQVALRLARAFRISVSTFAGERTAEVEKLIKGFQASSHAQTFKEDGEPVTEDELEWLRWVATYPPWEGRLRPRTMAGLVRLYRQHPELHAD